MEYTKLTKAYWEDQQKRIEKTLEKISERDSAVKKGYAIPDDGDLPIGSGRRMWMSVLFLDICGFSSRPNNSAEEQEKNMRMMTIFLPR